MHKTTDICADIGALMRKALQAPKLKSDAVAAGTKQSKETTADLELRGNPIYSPDDSLQKAASKLANLKAAGNGIKPSGGANAGPSHGALTPIHHENEASRKPHPPDGVTPGWMPHAEDGEAPKAEIKLAAHSVISKRNRRKSVYQRPARYGEWFDGDDEELDKMVEASNEDEEGDTIAASAANAARQQQDLKDRSNRRKSAFPAVGRPAPAAVASQSPADAGANIANQVRAIADGLCERLDGLIEESPAIPKGLGQREDGKTLRDKLLESWEGRVSLNAWFILHRRSGMPHAALLS